MYINRLIDNVLIEWKNINERHPLVIRGARQIGKSSSIRNVENEFDNFIEINCDQEPEIGSIFEKNLIHSQI